MTVRRMRGVGTGASVALVAMLALALAGCTQPRALESESGLLIPVATEDNGMQALFSGVLTRTAEGCLAVSSPDGGEADIVAAPPGTRLLEGDVIDMPMYGQLRIGDEVAFGGGFVTVDDRELRADIPAPCAGGPELFFINALG